jgi:hypothetical protein
MRIFLDWLYLFNSIVPGRRRVLSEALSDPPARNTESPLKGGPSARYALQLVNIPDRNISIRCRAGRKVSYNGPDRRSLLLTWTLF